MPEQKPITIYLAEWQKRMILDYMPNLKTVSKVTLDFALKKPVLMYMQLVMYKMPEPLAKGSWNLYLTDEQIKLISEKMGSRLKFSAVNVSPDVLGCKALQFK